MPFEEFEDYYSLINIRMNSSLPEIKIIHQKIYSSIYLKSLL